jgi:hypothetical protein
MTMEVPGLDDPVRTGDVRGEGYLRLYAECLSQLEPEVLDVILAGRLTEGWDLACAPDAGRALPWRSGGSGCRTRGGPATTRAADQDPGSWAQHPPDAAGIGLVRRSGFSGIGLTRENQSSAFYCCEKTRSHEDRICQAGQSVVSIERHILGRLYLPGKGQALKT